MAKRTKVTKNRSAGGPYIASAMFCDSLVKGDDGAITVIRIVDHITIGIPADAPADVPSDEKRVLATIQGLVGIKRGDSHRKHELQLIMNSPSGQSQVVMEKVIDLSEHAHGGFNVMLRSAIAIKEGGLFWMDVVLDGRRLTRAPILITVKRLEPEPNAETAPSTPAKKQRQRAKAK